MFENVFLDCLPSCAQVERWYFGLNLRRVEARKGESQSNGDVIELCRVFWHYRWNTRYIFCFGNVWKICRTIATVVLHKNATTVVTEAKRCAKKVALQTSKRGKRRQKVLTIANLFLNRLDNALRKTLRCKRDKKHRNKKLSKNCSFFPRFEANGQFFFACEATYFYHCIDKPNAIWYNAKK